MYNSTPVTPHTQTHTRIALLVLKSVSIVSQGSVAPVTIVDKNASRLLCTWFAKHWLPLRAGRQIRIYTYYALHSAAAPVTSKVDTPKSALGFGLGFAHTASLHSGSFSLVTAQKVHASQLLSYFNLFAQQSIQHTQIGMWDAHVCNALMCVSHVLTLTWGTHACIIGEICVLVRVWACARVYIYVRVCVCVWMRMCVQTWVLVCMSCVCLYAGPMSCVCVCR